MNEQLVQLDITDEQERHGALQEIHIKPELDLKEPTGHV